MPASRMMVQGIDFGVVRAEFDLPGAFSLRRRPMPRMRWIVSVPGVSTKRVSPS